MQVTNEKMASDDAPNAAILPDQAPELSVDVSFAIPCYISL